MGEVTFDKIFGQNMEPSLKSKDLDTLMAKLEQDNKILAELDCKLKNVTTSGLAENSETHEMFSSLPSLTSSHLFQSSLLVDTNVGSTVNTLNTLSKPSSHMSAQNGTQQISLFDNQQELEQQLRFDYLANSLVDDFNESKRANKSRIKSRIDGTPYSYDSIFKYSAHLNPEAFIEKTSSVTSRDLEKLMAKLENDNKILAELDRKLKNVTASGLIEPSYIYQMSSSLPSLNTSHLIRSSILTGNCIGSSTSALSKPSINLIAHNGTTQQMNQLLHSHQTPFQQQIDELKLAEDIVDSIEIPNRGRCKVYIARYNYDPFKQSPNDNPEAEVVLLAGDFVLIFGNIDEDGFYFGELLDGRRGLIPSNFVEKLTGEDLFEFQASVLYGNNRDSESDTASYPPEFYDAILNDTMCHTNFQHLLAPDDFHRINDYIDLEDITEIDEDISDLERAEVETAKNTVAPPQRLILERQLHKSVLIGWLHPDCPKSIIESFQIYVDGVLKSSIPSGDRTKALVEGVDSSMPHRISVRSIDRSGRQSKDPACTIVIGKNIPFAPCCVKASNITSDSAVISWIPCNSNFYHVVAVNSVEVRTVRPSVFKHLITGLAANTLYRVSVRAKPGKLLCSDEKNPKKLEMLTTFVDFRTLPKSLPDPPVDIQVESGPQEGTLLVTWLPVTLNQFGTSNNCPVTGYAVFAGHKKLSEIDSPTGDHALLDISLLEHLHKKAITVRTKSGENLSQDSMPCQIPDEFLKLPIIPLNKKSTPYDHRTNKQVVSRPSTRTSATNRALQQKHHQQSQHLTHPQTHHSITGHITGQHIEHEENLCDKDLISRMNIPAIEITKDTPSESINPIESYSEEEFDASMRQRAAMTARNYGMSPVPPQRTRAISDYERSHFGPSEHMPNRRAQTQRDRERGVRWFVALFDYDPLSMSPNPDAAEEELPFQEGQLIKIYGDKDADGFYRGEANGRVGFVPCNMVSEVQHDNDADQRLRHGTSANDPWAHLHVRKMVALYDYDPQELSPNVDAEMELAFNTGDIVYVYGDMDEDGFFMGEINGVRGLVPSNFLSETGPMGTMGAMGTMGTMGPMGAIDANARHGKQQSLQQVGQRGDHRMAMEGQNIQHPHMAQIMHSHQQQGEPRRTQGGIQSYITGQPLAGPGLQGQHQHQYIQHQQGIQAQHQSMYNNQQQYQQQQQPNQMMGRGMRQQGPQVGMGGQQQPSQTQYNAMFQLQGGVAMPGNKQRPTSLDLNSATNPRLNQPNHNTNQQQQQQQQHQQQQQQHTGMLGSLFASGKKILEEATTPLGARGPFAHPNQSHPTMGHHPFGAQQPIGSYGQQYGQSGQQMSQQMAQQMGQQMGQQQGGTILNTMKNIFKL